MGVIGQIPILYTDRNEFGCRGEHGSLVSDRNVYNFLFEVFLLLLRYCFLIGVFTIITWFLYFLAFLGVILYSLTTFYMI